MRMVEVIGFVLILGLGACTAEIEENYISTDKFEIQGDYQVDIIAAEPLIEAPVAIDWDREGRLWVIEMPDYMPDIDGLGEKEARGRIVILEDKNKNGRMDHSTVFLDHLHQPRAMALLYGGLLYAESPNLWYVPIEDDKPGQPQLVDSLYATGGNVEHQPNGLLLNIDNWIYNAKSNYRYKKVGETWLKEPTAFRGQWGITNDMLGYVYSNNNSNGLYGDQVLPGTATANPYYNPKAAVNKDILNNRRIYPAHSTVINRGYNDILDEEDKVQYMTSTCGPHVSSGAVASGDAFICVPEGNIIKQVSLNYGDKINAKNVFEDVEFLTSTDEAFRPVDINTGADDNLYITDFHRGVIQHKIYMTAYLREKLIERGLDSIVGMGRIWRIRPTAANGLSNGGLDLTNLSSSKLVGNLKSTNGEVRIKSQHELILRNDSDVVKDLQDIIQANSSVHETIHALYTLEGMGKDLSGIVSHLKNMKDPAVVSHLIKMAAESNKLDFLKSVIQHFRDDKDTKVAYQIAHGLGRLIKDSPALCSSLYNSYMSLYPQDQVMVDMVMSGIYENEEELGNLIDLAQYPLYLKAYNRLMKNLKEENIVSIHRPPAAIESMGKSKGIELFATHCGACHGIGGLGISGLAPALAGGAIVDADINHLVLTLFTGLQGPIHVNDEIENYNVTMPGLKTNQEISDDDIAAIVNYVSNAFSKKIQQVNKEQVTNIRKMAMTFDHVPSESEILKTKIEVD